MNKQALKVHENLTNRIARTIKLPPGIILRKALRIFSKLKKQQFLRQKDRKCSSYSSDFPQGSLYSYLPSIDPICFSEDQQAIAGICNNYLGHRFDILGSGWIEVEHGMNCRGLESIHYQMGKSIEANPDGFWLKEFINSNNVQESQRIWRLIYSNQDNLRSVSYIYNPIDWQLDIKSGYRWRESTWYCDISISPGPGVDAKVPWELSRMQHLVQLAWAYAITINSKKTVTPNLFQSPNSYVLDFRNQILDFIATNPPRFGINWKCPMEVAIRATNWLIAYDLLKVNGVNFDYKFEQVFFRSIYEHGNHIINNLEWNEEQRSNHYLANTVGLLFIAAYLPCTPVTDTWLAFAVQEFINETKIQFYSDGGNFEASTSYHRLSAEMVCYSIALMMSLSDKKIEALKNYDQSLHKVYPKLKLAPTTFYDHLNINFQIPIPVWLTERLEKMAEFTMHITKPNGHIAQIGDNDSSRFIKFQPNFIKTNVAEAKKKYANLNGYNNMPGDADYWEEDILDHRHLVAAINGLFVRKDFTSFIGNTILDNEIVKQLAGNARLSSYIKEGQPTSAECKRYGNKVVWEQLIEQSKKIEFSKRQTAYIKIDENDYRKKLKLFAYPDSGIYIYSSERIFLLIRCGSIGQNGFGGHAHNDQLSIELQVNSIDWITDPGTYLYMPLPEYRNQYRSVSAHAGPKLVDDREPSRLDLGLFRLGDEAKAKCLYFGRKGFAGKHWGYGEPVYRLIKLMKQGIRILDFTEGNIPLKPIYRNKRPNDEITNSVAFSPGYGMKYIIAQKS
jgi:hypothetical protein